MTEFRRDLDLARFETAEDTTIGEISPKYVASMANMSKSEQVRSKGYMKLWVDEYGARNPRQIRPMEIQEWINALRERRGFGEDSYNKYVACFKDFYAFLVKNHFADENPMTGF